MARRRPGLPAGIAGAPVGRSADLDRVLALDRRPRLEDDSPEAAETVETVSRWFLRPDGDRNHDCQLEHRRPCIRRLRPVQAWSLLELGTERGMFGFVGMGFGKTIVNILAPLALAGCEVALLLAPPSLMTQLARMYRHAAEHWVVPSLRIYGSDAWRCEAPPIGGRPAPLLAAMPYTMLSTADCSTFLDNLQPDLVIGDECQHLSDVSSARTKRLLRYARDADDAGRDVRYAFHSGTPTGDSIMDYQHLLVLALRERAPLPTDPDVARTWAAAIDPQPWPSPAGELAALCPNGEHVQEGYRSRLMETPGVVSTVEASVDVEVVVIERSPDAPRDLRDVMAEVRRTWVRPDGMKEFEDKIEQWTCLHNLACGFYLRWRFPRGETDAQIDRWIGRQKDWNRQVREILKVDRPRMDSPLLCARAAARALAGLPDMPESPAWDCPEWEPWAQVRGTVRPETEAVWVSDFVVEDLSAWLAEEPSICWFESVEFGARVAEISGAEHHGGGLGAGERIDRCDPRRSIVASIRSHGTGRDGLQYKYRRQAFPQPFASATGFEQAFARLARPGQAAGTVEAVIYGHTPELRDSLAKARDRARYVNRTTGARVRLVSDD